METRQSMTTPFILGTPLTPEMELPLDIPGGRIYVAYVVAGGSRRIIEAGRVDVASTNLNSKYHRSKWVGALIMDQLHPLHSSILDSQPVNYFPYPEDLVDWPVSTAFPADPVNPAPDFPRMARSSGGPSP